MCDGCDGKCDGYVMDETPVGEGCDGCDGLLETIRLGDFFIIASAGLVPPPCDGCVMDCDGYVMDETPVGEGCDGCDGLLETIRLGDLTYLTRSGSPATSRGLVLRSVLKGLKSSRNL
jgi:hypothetical protein